MWCMEWVCVYGSVSIGNNTGLLDNACNVYLDRCNSHHLEGENNSL